MDIIWMLLCCVALCDFETIDANEQAQVIPSGPSLMLEQRIEELESIVHDHEKNKTLLLGKIALLTKKSQQCEFESQKYFSSQASCSPQTQDIMSHGPELSRCRSEAVELVKIRTKDIEDALIDVRQANKNLERRYEALGKQFNATQRTRLLLEKELNLWRAREYRQNMHNIDQVHAETNVIDRECSEKLMKCQALMNSTESMRLILRKELKQAKEGKRECTKNYTELLTGLEYVKKKFLGDVIVHQAEEADETISFGESMAVMDVIELIASTWLIIARKNAEKSRHSAHAELTQSIASSLTATEALLHFVNDNIEINSSLFRQIVEVATKMTVEGHAASASTPTISTTLSSSIFQACLHQEKHQVETLMAAEQAIKTCTDTRLFFEQYMEPCPTPLSECQGVTAPSKTQHSGQIG